MKQKYAFFDVDNTIYIGYSAGELINYLIEQKIVDPKINTICNKATAEYMKRKINYHTLSQIVLDQCSYALKGLTVNDVETHINNLFAKKRQVFMRWVKPTFKFLRGKGFNIILISAGPDVFIKKIAALLNVDYWFATIMKEKKGIYTGAPVKLLNELEKKKVMLQFLDNKDTFSVGFGDSVGDIPLLEMVDKAFVLHNNFHREILMYAKKNNWVIFRDNLEVINQIKSILGGS